MGKVYFVNSGSPMVARTTKASISLDSFVKNIDANIKEKIIKHLEEEAIFKLVFKFRKHINNGGYGITAKQPPKYMSIRKWSGKLERKGDGSAKILFKNSALDTAKSFPYVTTLYLGTRHRHYPDGYAARKQGLDKEKVQWIKNDVKNVIIDEVRTALKGLNK